MFKNRKFSAPLFAYNWSSFLNKMYLLNINFEEEEKIKLVKMKIKFVFGMMC